MLQKHTKDKKLLYSKPKVQVKGLIKRQQQELINLKYLIKNQINANFKLIESEKSLKATISELNEKNNNLMAINESLGLEDGGIEEQLLAIKTKMKNY